VREGEGNTQQGAECVASEVSSDGVRRYSWVVP
jgi:hypothetical protein